MKTSRKAHKVEKADNKNTIMEKTSNKCLYFFNQGFFIHDYEYI